MNGTVFRLTLNQLAKQRRTLAVLGLCAVPLLLALVARANAGDLDADRWTVSVLYQGIVVGMVLPLVALVLGTAALGSEFEDGTAVYLLARPIPRRAIVFAKVLAAWLVTAAIVGVTALLAGLLAPGDDRQLAIVAGFSVATVAGSLVYCALFVMLSIVTSRALIAGLAYVFLWEGIVTGLFQGTRVLSVREYTLALGDLLADTPRRVFEAQIGSGTAGVMVVVVTAAATWLAISSLERWELKGESA